MPTEVRSPINRKGSAVGSDQPLSPGANSNPSRASADAATARHSEPPEPTQKEEDARRGKKPAPSLPEE